MNKLYKTAYMFLLWAAFCLCGCAGKENSQMYLEAKTQDSQHIKKEDTVCDTSASDVSDAKEAETCFVYVCGAVKRPGVFELPRGSRVYEAVAMAGGLCKDAYEKGINQAKQIEDGEMIEVLTEKEQKELAQQEHPGQSQQEQADGRIDINTASAQQLMTLNGIGESKAAGIIEYREKNGRFSSTEELMNVTGIGKGVYARIKDKITVIR